MTKDGISNTNDHSNNNAKVVGHPDLDLETMVTRKLFHHKMPPTKGRPLLRKMKHDASKTLGEWTKKQCDTLELHKLDIGSTINNL
jgi:hypothetical protein